LTEGNEANEDILFRLLLLFFTATIFRDAAGHVQAILHFAFFSTANN
jgi:hypothetical protein